jgi:eukaryotic-like serine/threonine-protein kinase
VTNSAPAHPAPDRLVAWRVGRLSAAEAAEVEQHLAGCESCQTLANALHPELLRTLLTPAPGDTPSAAGEMPTAVHPMVAQSSPPLPDAVPGIPAELVDHPRYRVLGLLGVGGMGSVYKAEHRMMERLVAVKVINRSLTGDESAIERFRREVRTAAKLSHANIVTAFDAEQVGDLHFFVMEFIDGNSLDRWVGKVGRLPVQEACNYIRQAALGLQYAHERGMVHRDIKPQNLLRTKDGEVKILDFGLARFASERTGKDALTHTGMAMGTPDYIAPEQANDARTADVRADIYSLGCTLYFLLTGRVPFPDGTTLQKFIAHLEQTPRSVREARPDVPQELEAVLARMMAKKPADRYQQPLDAANALTPFLPGAPVLTPTLLRAVELEEDVPVAQLMPQQVEPFQPAERPSRVRRRRDWDVEGIPEAEPLDSARARAIVLARQLGMASIILGILGLPFSCLTCLSVFPSAFSLIGLGLAGASGYLAYKHHSRQFGLAIGGACLNIIAFLLTIGASIQGLR